eukprot:327196_1
MALQIINTLIKQIEKNCESKTDENDESKHFIFHITGYGKFANIMDNPSKRVIDNLIKNDFLQNAIDSDIVTIGSLHVMTASGRQGKDELLKLRKKKHQVETWEEETVRSLPPLAPRTRPRRPPRVRSTPLRISRSRSAPTTCTSAASAWWASPGPSRRWSCRPTWTTSTPSSRRLLLRPTPPGPRTRRRAGKKNLLHVGETH